MMKLILCLIALFVVVNAQTSGTCLPQAYADFWNLPILLDTTTPVEAGGFCNADGTTTKDLCCDATILENLKSYFDTVDTNIAASVSAFKDTTKNTDIHELIYGALGNAGLTTGVAFPPNIQTAIDNIIKAYQDFFNDGPGTFGKCLNGIKDYYAGILCGFCSPNWDTMVDISGGSGSGTYTVQFTLSDNTCDNIADACLPFVKSLYPIFAAIIDLEIAFGVPAETAGSFFPCSDADCPAFACDFVHGFEVPQGQVDFSDVIGESRRRALGTLESPTDLKNFFNRQSSGSAVTASNEYSAGGYDAFEAGQNSKFTNGSSAFTVVPSLFLALVALLFLLF